ncbi:archaeosortase/exosortase family protein [Fulvivirga sp. M361]|uniref:archaeosortase/exosortase family protein n=1 Tax=Fulvivirga sp. M361 TaxID=2594266 RepID=UPI001629E408|nr:archaeosortase/exosortase family protein [Fulvivirga sp. M361]
MATYKTQIVFLVKLITIYLALYFIVKIFIGVTSEGGALYSPWLDIHFDVISGFRNILLGFSEYLLNTLGYDPQRTEFTLNIDNSPGIRLVYACMGFELICGYTALILAYPFYGKRTVIYLLSGIVLIELLNIIRICGLTILFSHGHMSWFDTVDHHDIFNFTVVISLIIVYITYLKGIKSAE